MSITTRVPTIRNRRTKLSGFVGTAPAEPRVPDGRTRTSIVVWLSLGWLALIALAAVVAPFLPFLPQPATPVGMPRLAPALGSFELLLGTDTIGRSIMTRILYGAQISLTVAVVAGAFAFTVGTFFGMLAGYFRSLTDGIIALITDVMLAFPPLILLLAIASLVTPDVRTVTIGLGIVGIPTFVRLARANAMSWGSREFVRAARNMGAGHPRILFREIMPNVIPPVASYLPIVMASMIVAEGGLSFLGLGVPPPTPSWGGMISEGKSIIAQAPHIVLIPITFIFLTIFSLNQVGDRLRARFDKSAS